MAWRKATIKEINKRESAGIEPARFPNEVFELYSVPSFDLKQPEIITGAEIGSTKQIVEEGDVLICKINPRINRVWVVGNKTNNRKIASSEWIVVSTKGTIDSRYLMYEFSAPFFRKLLESEVSGVGGSLTRARPKLVENYPFPLAAPPEQKRIVAKLDKLFAHLDQLKARLEKIPELLKQFRQAVLTQAVTGKLTEEWRAAKKISFNRVRQKTSECCQVVQSGGTPREGFQQEGVPFLKVYNIVDQKIDFFYKPQFISAQIHLTGQRKSITKPGDVLMNIVGPPLGKIAIVPDDFHEWNINQAITLFRPKEYLSNKFLYYYFCEGTVIRDIINKTRGMVGQSNISLSQCRDFEINLPPIEEQQEIVRRAESLFALTDRIEASYKSLKEKMDQLPQAILTKAFRGELVKSDEQEVFEEIQSLAAEATVTYDKMKA